MECRECGCTDIEVNRKDFYETKGKTLGQVEKALLSNAKGLKRIYRYEGSYVFITCAWCNADIEVMKY